jgi:hypothetical protein
MGKMPTHIRSFIQDMKPLYYVAKMLGIAPFTLKIYAATNEEIVDIKLTSNICGFAASAIIVIVLLIGFVFDTYMPLFSLRQDPLYVLTYVVSVPLNFVCSLVLVIMNSTVNRYKLEKLVKKFTSIDKLLTVLRSRYFCQRESKKIHVFIPMLVLVVLLLSCDVLIVIGILNPVFCIIERSCQIITLVAIMQYCKMALMIRGRLSVVYEILSWTFFKGPSHINCDILGTGEFTVNSKLCNQRCKTLHSSRCLLRDDLESFNGIQTNLKMVPVFEVELLLKLRRIYYHLFECAKYINFMYGLPILIYIFRTATGLISLLYYIGTLFKERTEIIFILRGLTWTIFLLGAIISLTVICDMAASKSKDIRHKLQALMLRANVSSDVEKQLHLFCQQMSDDRIAFTAAGLFDVNLSFLCTFLTSITTYIVVLIQFKLQ